MFVNEYETRNAIFNLKMKLFFARCSFRKTYSFFRIHVACSMHVNFTKSDRPGCPLCPAERLWKSRTFFRWLGSLSKDVFPVQRTMLSNRPAAIFLGDNIKTVSPLVIRKFVWESLHSVSKRLSTSEKDYWNPQSHRKRRRKKHLGEG